MVGGGLEEQANRSRLVLNAVIYAEVSVGFQHIKDLEEALPPSLIAREAIPYEAAFVAGKAFLAYRRRGGAKGSPLPDFLIGAHAAVREYFVLTRDPRRFQTYFPTVDLILPED
jgi:predicted nucleic acid-binding protein